MSLSIDPSNENSLIDFFSKFKHLSNTELGVVAGRSPSTIRRWKRMCGLSSGNKPISEPQFTKKQINEVVPIDWDSKEWFSDQYINKKHGVLKIARILGRSRTLVLSRLDRYGIDTRSQKDSTKSSNGCKTFAWLSKYYIENKWSIEQCAKSAGVVNETIKEWLIEFGMETRTTSEALIGRKRPKSDKPKTVNTNTNRVKRELPPEFKANIERVKERAKRRREERTSNPQTDLLVQLGEDLEGLADS